MVAFFGFCEYHRRSDERIVAAERLAQEKARHDEMMQIIRQLQQELVKLRLEKEELQKQLSATVWPDFHVYWHSLLDFLGGVPNGIPSSWAISFYAIWTWIVFVALLVVAAVTYRLYYWLSRFGSAVRRTLKRKDHLVDGWRAERMMTGSEFSVAEGLPSFQCEILTPNDVDSGGSGEYTFRGMGIRFEGDVLVTAYHVVVDAAKILLRTSKGTKVVDLAEPMMLDGDLVGYRLAKKTFSDLGIKSAKTGVMQGVRPTMVYVVGGSEPKRSIGPLVAAEFGYVRYGGSTIAGFSGSAYHINNQVYGLHIGCSSKSNTGYDASFIKTKLKRFQEGTVDYRRFFDGVLAKIKRRGGKRIKYARSGGAGEIMIYSDGQYHEVERNNVPKDMWDEMEEVSTGAALESSFQECDKADGDHKSFLGSLGGRNLPPLTSEKQLNHADVMPEPGCSKTMVELVASKNVLPKSLETVSDCVKTVRMLQGALARLESTSAKSSEA